MSYDKSGRRLSADCISLFNLSIDARGIVFFDTEDAQDNMMLTDGHAEVPRARSYRRGRQMQKAELLCICDSCWKAGGRQYEVVVFDAEPKALRGGTYLSTLVCAL